MSIRLRLTLLYSVILTLTLVAFGTLVYVRQVQETLDIETQALIGIGKRFAEGRQKPPDRTPSDPPANFTERYFVRRSPDGEILDIQTPDDVHLPLSEEALQTAQNGETWMEIAQVGAERILVYTVPVVVDGQITEILQMGSSLAARDQSLRALGTGLLVGGTVATIIAFGLGWVLAGMALRPIHRLTQTAQAIGVERDFSRRVEHTGPDDELGRLAKTFNTMLAELQAAYQQVEQSLEMQRRFAADVSHELRTPLTTLNGNIELLRREPPISDEDRAEVRADMASESKRLIRLVNDLLALARADARQPLQSEPVWLKPIIRDVCRQARLLDRDRAIACDVMPDVAVLGEEDALRQVMLILLDNALKHTDGAIVVATQATDERVAISVHDSGPGIERELLPHLFERFSRGEASVAEAGTGLGLAIAKALVEAQDGSIAVESQEGQGSVFTVTLPRTAW